MVRHMLGEKGRSKLWVEGLRWVVWVNGNKVPVGVVVVWKELDGVGRENN